MPNRIRKLTVELRRVSPAEADVWVKAELDAVTPTTELRGKLVGPRCPGVTTIELAYPFRPPPSAPAAGANTLAARVVIPEPNLWTDQTPFVYEGSLELWEEGERCDTSPVTVRLRRS
jgi:hypothetical protein